MNRQNVKRYQKALSEALLASVHPLHKAQAPALFDKAKRIKLQLNRAELQIANFWEAEVKRNYEKPGP